MKKGIVIIVLITIFAVMFYGIRYVKKPVDTEVAYPVKYEDYISGEAYIVKNEYVSTAPVSGTVYRYAADGSRVGKNRKIASVYEGSVNSDAIQELGNLEKKITALQSQKSESMVVYGESEENKIIAYKDEIINSVYDGDIENISKYKQDIKDARNGDDESGDSVDSELLQLVSTKQQLESSIGTKKKDIYSKSSGIFVSDVDGYEGTLTPTDIKDFTVSRFDALELAENTRKDTVNSGEAFCKVVDNSEWYAAVKLEKGSLPDEYTAGKSVKLKFDSLIGVEADAVITGISGEENGYIVVICKSSSYIDGIYALRYSKVQLLLASYTGYKVPVYAVKVQDGQSGVLVDVGNSSVFRPCEVVYTNNDEGFVILKPLEDTSNTLKTSDKILLGEK